MNEAKTEKQKTKVMTVLEERGLGAFADEIADALIHGDFKNPVKTAGNCEFYFGASAMEDIAWAEVRENCPEIWWNFIDVYRYGKYLEHINHYEWTEHGAVLIL